MSGIGRRVRLMRPGAAAPGLAHHCEPLPAGGGAPGLPAGESAGESAGELAGESAGAPAPSAAGPPGAAGEPACCSVWTGGGLLGSEACCCPSSHAATPSASARAEPVRTAFSMMFISTGGTAPTTPRIFAKFPGQTQAGQPPRSGAVYRLTVLMLFLAELPVNSVE